MNLIGNWEDSFAGGSPKARSVPTAGNTRPVETHISMTLLGFEHTIPVLELSKTVHASDRAFILLDQTTHSIPTEVVK
jgi:hypothetical protein